MTLPTLEPTPAMPQIGGEITYLGIVLRRYSKTGFEIHHNGVIRAAGQALARQERAFWKALNTIRELRGLEGLPQPCRMCGQRPRRRDSNCCAVCKPPPVRKTKAVKQPKVEAEIVVQNFRAARVACDALIARRFGLDKVPYTPKPEDDFWFYMFAHGYTADESWIG